MTCPDVTFLILTSRGYRLLLYFDWPILESADSLSLIFSHPQIYILELDKHSSQAISNQPDMEHSSAALFPLALEAALIAGTLQAKLHGVRHLLPFDLPCYLLSFLFVNRPSSPRSPLSVSTSE